MTRYSNRRRGAVTPALNRIPRQHIHSLAIKNVVNNLGRLEDSILVNNHDLVLVDALVLDNSFLDLSSIGQHSLCRDISIEFALRQ